MFGYLCMVWAGLRAGSVPSFSVRAEGRGAVLHISLKATEPFPSGSIEARVRVADPLAVQAQEAGLADTRDQQKVIESEFRQAESKQPDKAFQAVLLHGLEVAGQREQDFLPDRVRIERVVDLHPVGNQAEIDLDLTHEMILAQVGPITDLELSVEVAPEGDWAEAQAIRHPKSALTHPLDFNIPFTVKRQFLLAPPGHRRLVPAGKGFLVQRFTGALLSDEYLFGWLWLPTEWSADEGPDRLISTPGLEIWSRDNRLALASGKDLRLTVVDLTQGIDADWIVLFQHQDRNGFVALFKVEEPANPGNPGGHCGAGTDTDLVFLSVGSAPQAPKIQVVNLETCQGGPEIQTDAKTEKCGPWTWILEGAAEGDSRKVTFDPVHPGRGIRTERVAAGH